MLKDPEKDLRLIASAETYYRTGNIETFLQEGWEWVWNIGRYKFGMDDDSCADVVYRFVQDGERILERFREYGYRNFPAFLIVCIRNLFLNERKKVSRRREQDSKSGLLYEDQFRDPNEKNFADLVLREEDAVSFTIHTVLEKFDPKISLIVKMRHRIRFRLREIRILHSKLKEISLNLRTYVLQDEDEEKIQRLRKKEVADRLSEVYQVLNQPQLKNPDKWRTRRSSLVHRRNSLPDEKSFRKIGFYLSLSEHVVRRQYYAAISSIRTEREIRRIDFLDAA